MPAAENRDQDPPAADARSRSRIGPGALIALALLAGTFAWWAWQDGAYFAVVVLPGTILLCLGAALLVGLAPWRLRLSRSPAVIVALVALLALAAWSALSAIWSPTPEIAIGDGQRIAVYAVAFGLGLGLCNLLGKRSNLSPLPIAFAAAFAGVATIIALGGADRALDVLETDGTLDYPLGYRNANAAFFAIALFPALGIASARDLDWRLRAAGLGTATLCIDLFLLSQSRASAPAIAIGMAVYLIASPFRLRALSWLVLAALPAVGILPALTALYSAAGDAGDRLPGLTDEIHRVAIVAAATALVGTVLGGLAARFERRLPGLGSSTADSNRVIGGGLIAIAVAALIGFVVAVGNPGDWLSERYDEFRHSGSPDLSQEATRFGFSTGSNRYDIWRVALDDVGEEPLLGDGGGGFEYSYLRQREVGHQNLRDAHSVEMELLSELGIVGFALFVIAIAAAVAGVLRARRLGPSAAALAAIALASTAYWLVHTSVDWFWPYPAIVAPVLALLGCACAAAVRTEQRAAGSRWPRIGLIVALVALALSAVPPFLAQRYIDDAYSSWRTDLDRAYDDLDRARSLNPLATLPLLAEGSIARAAGDRERALAAFRQAAEERPEEWATWYLLAQLEARSDPALARERIRMALELNPLDLTIAQLAEKLGVDPETGGRLPRGESGQ